MSHKSIQIKDLEVSFFGKICFSNFTTMINYGSRIAVIGQNGSGKSTLLKILKGDYEQTGGKIIGSKDIIFGYLPQVVEDFDSLSGGQRLNRALTVELCKNPDVLLLDEPTNHLDLENRKTLLKMLSLYTGTLIVVSHDQELIRKCVDTIWHIDNGKINVFSGNYDDYLVDIKRKRKSIEDDLSRLNRQKKEIHDSLMREQIRSSKSRAKGEQKIAQKKWLPIVGNAYKSGAEKASGKKKLEIDNKKSELSEKLNELRLPEIIVPKFSLTTEKIGNNSIITIKDGCVRYQHKDFVLRKLSLSIFSRDRIAILGNNGSGKTTLIRAILGDSLIEKTGIWILPKPEEVGYLDQHYKTLDPEATVFQTIKDLVPDQADDQIRKLLNDFLFRKNEDVNKKIKNLSGGEKARLSLAQISAKTPKLLILDEVTNNLDFETRNHVIDVLKGYPGTLIVISHDRDFLNEIGISDFYLIKDLALVLN